MTEQHELKPGPSWNSQMGSDPETSIESLNAEGELLVGNGNIARKTDFDFDEEKQPGLRQLIASIFNMVLIQLNRISDGERVAVRRERGGDTKEILDNIRRTRKADMQQNIDQIKRVLGMKRS